MALARRTRISVLALIPLLFAACGTTVHRHTIELAIDDPAGGLGAPPIEVSIFDNSMGYGREFAMRNRGSAAPGSPYRHEYSSTDVGTFGAGPPSTLRLAFSIPKLEPEGYWLVSLEPRKGMESVSQAAFVRYGEYFPSAGSKLVPVRYTAAESSGGWTIRMTVELSAGP